LQSQRSSSRPPALAVVNQVAERPDILAPDFAMTDWDRVGWKDNFTQRAFAAWN
jgi:hypothetical protein